MLYPQSNDHRWSLSLDGLWAFRAQREGEDAKGWEAGFASERLVGVPAAFNEQFTDYETFNHMGVVWYARTLTVPREWLKKRVSLRFGAVNYKADVFLNGQLLGEHETGFTPFELPVAGALRAGENLLVVKVDCALSPYTVPQGGFDKAAIPGQTSSFHPSVNFDFFPYSGLHRPVSLVVTDEAALSGLRIDTAMEGADAVLRVRGETLGPAESVRLAVEGVAGEGWNGEVRSGLFEGRLRIPAAKRWDLGAPHLYTLRVEVRRGGAVVDSYAQEFGVREVKIEGDRLLLNGRSVYLKGFGKHEELPVLGRTVSHAGNVRDFELMKWIGANSFRTSHYPHSEEVLQLADRAGILVIGETPAVSMIPSVATPRTLELHCQTVREMIRRDYNHPSVIMWCLANEPHAQEPEALPYFEKVYAAGRAEDATRPHMHVTWRLPGRDRCHHLSDIIGFNCYPGWYGGGDKLENTQAYLRKLLDEVRAETKKPIMISEIGGDAMIGLHSLPSSLWTEDYQADLLEANLSVAREKDYVIGEHVWCFADFHTPQNHFRAHGSRKGVFTRDRQPKLAARALRKLWSGPDPR